MRGRSDSGRRCHRTAADLTTGDTSATFSASNAAATATTPSEAILPATGTTDIAADTSLGELAINIAAAGGPIAPWRQRPGRPGRALSR